MTRHEQRELAFKMLFRVEFHSMEEMPKQMELFFESLGAGQMKLFFEEDEIVLASEEVEEISEKFRLIQEKLTDIDSQVSEKAQGWDISRMGKVELAIIRLAVYEILYDEDIPGSVAINEAVEIAKKYGQDNSGGFVNAILAKFV